MFTPLRVAMGAIATLGLSAFAPVAAAHAAAPRDASGADHVVFVQTDDPAGNQVVAYDRADDGTLTLAATYDTGGVGGVLNGSVVDHLASQGSLTYDATHRLLYAVNAGSDTVSVFAVNGDRLELRQVIGADGHFPVSLTVRGDLVYVLTALDGGAVTGYRVAGDRLHHIARSTRSLGLKISSDTSQFTHTPGQVAFSPDGSQLLVTTKAASNAVDVFAVNADGRPSASPVVNSEPGTVPFAVTFDATGHLLITDAGTNALATYTLDPDGSITLLNSVGTGQAATCWVTAAQGIFFVSNAGSSSISSFGETPDGTLSLLATTSTHAGTVDAAASAGGQFLYVQTGVNGNVDEFRVSPNGALTSLGSVTVPGSMGGEGIVAA